LVRDQEVPSSNLGAPTIILKGLAPKSDCSKSTNPYHLCGSQTGRVALPKGIDSPKGG